MKTLKLLNKKYLSILLIFFLTISLNLKAEEEPVDIWKLERTSTFQFQIQQIRLMLFCF